VPVADYRFGSVRRVGMACASSWSFPHREMSMLFRFLAQAAIASAHAQRPDGVMRIDNHLSVNPR